MILEKLYKLVGFKSSVDKNDEIVYIVSHPKCGRTWLQVVLGKLFSLEYGVPEDVFLRHMGASYNQIPQIRFTHGGSTELVKKFKTDTFKGRDIVLIVRDPRDTVVSYYHQKTKRSHDYKGDIDFKGDISSFIRDDKYGINKIIKYMNVWYENRDILKALCIIRY